MSEHDFKRLVTPKEVSVMFNVAEETLTNWRSREIGPDYIKLGGRVMYLIEDVNKFIEDNKIITGKRL